MKTIVSISTKLWIFIFYQSFIDFQLQVMGCNLFVLEALDYKEAIAAMFWHHLTSNSFQAIVE